MIRVWLSTVLLAGGAFIGFTSLLSNVFLPFETKSALSFAIFEIAFVTLPALIVLFSAELLRLSRGATWAGIALAIGARFITSLSAEAGVAAINQVLLELVGLLLAIMVVRVASTHIVGSPANRLPSRT